MRPEVTDQYVATETLQWRGDTIEPGELVRPQYEGANYGALQRAGKIRRVVLLPRDEYDQLLQEAFLRDPPDDLTRVEYDKLITLLKRAGVDPEEEIEGEGAQGYIKKHQLVEKLEEVLDE